MIAWARIGRAPAVPPAADTLEIPVATAGVLTVGHADFHDLRRTNATQAAASGVDLRTLAARIGHTDLAMLERHYAMVVGSAEHEAAEKIQKTFDRLTSNVVPIKSGS